MLFITTLGVPKAVPEIPIPTVAPPRSTVLTTPVIQLLATTAPLIPPLVTLVELAVPVPIASPTVSLLLPLVFEILTLLNVTCGLVSLAINTAFLETLSVPVAEMSFWVITKPVLGLAVVEPAE